MVDEPQIGGGNGNGNRDALGRMVLSQTIDNVNDRFMTIAKNLARMGISTEPATKFEAGAHHSLVTRIGDWTSSSRQPAKTEVEPTRERRDREADRLARALREGVGRELFKDGGKSSDADLERDVRTSLRASGMDEQAVAEAAAAVARRLREKVESLVQGRSLSGNLSDEGQARRELHAEADGNTKARDAANTGLKPADLSAGNAFLDRMRVAAFSRPKDDGIAEAQLREQEKTNAKLEEIKEWTKKSKQGTHTATFARGRY